MIVTSAAERAKFNPEKMGKATLFEGERLFAGLNCFEAGQEHLPHTHEGQDKLYLILEGSGAVRIGDKEELLSAGAAAFAPSGVVHSIRNPGPDRLVVLAVLAPPPSKK
jgi:mannose-6-phosphate isomerase-like protein (cupin superfamily)